MISLGDHQTLDFVDIASVSPLAAIFMEHLEETAIATVPMTYKHKLWKRYVDDILEVVNKEAVEELADHLDTIGDTNSIKFTYGQEKERKMPFSDTLIVRRGGSFCKASGLP